MSLGFEALARAQYLLRRKPSLEKLPLLEQVNFCCYRSTDSSTCRIMPLTYFIG